MKAMINDGSDVLKNGWSSWCAVSSFSSVNAVSNNSKMHSFRLELSVGQLAYDNGSVSFQGEITDLNMRTSTDLDLPGSTCTSQLQGDLVSWVMFDDGGSKVMHPSSCPSNTRCPPGYQHQNCTEIGNLSQVMRKPCLWGLWPGKTQNWPT